MERAAAEAAHMSAPDHGPNRSRRFLLLLKGRPHMSQSSKARGETDKSRAYPSRASAMLGLCSTCLRLPENDRTPLANSPDWLKAAPMWENLLASWRQSGQKQDHCPSLLNHNAKYKRLLPPYCDFANGVRSLLDRAIAWPIALWMHQQALWCRDG